MHVCTHRHTHTHTHTHTHMGEQMHIYTHTHARGHAHRRNPPPPTHITPMGEIPPHTPPWDPPRKPTADYSLGTLATNRPPDFLLGHPNTGAELRGPPPTRRGIRNGTQIAPELMRLRPQDGLLSGPLRKSTPFKTIFKEGVREQRMQSKAT